MYREFEVMSDREIEVNLAIQRLRQFCTPDEIDILPAPQYLIRYTRDVDVEINSKVETQLGRAIDEAIAQVDMAWTVLMLVNWGNKSTDEAVKSANASELRQLSEK
jgi:citrate lyase gamma subunit